MQIAYLSIDKFYTYHYLFFPAFLGLVHGSK